MRGAEELETLAGSVGFKTHALFEGRGHLYITKNACHDSRLWQLWKDPCPEAMAVVRSVASISWVVSLGDYGIQWRVLADTASLLTWV